MVFRDHFSAHASDYARYRPTYPDEIFGFLAGITRRKERAWDCATGNGQAATALAAHFRQVVATDASLRQLGRAVAAAGVHYVASSAHGAALRDDSVDLITVAQAVHWFDFGRFWSEVRRIGRPGAMVAVWCYETFRVDAAVDEIVRSFYDGDVGQFWPPERLYIDRRYTTIPFPFVERGSPEFEMRVTWTLPRLIDYVGTWSAVRRYRGANGIDPLPLLYERLAAVWDPPSEERDLRFRISMRVGEVG